MKSFPSIFTKNDMVTPGMAGANIKDLLKNAAGQLMNNILGGSAEGETQKNELYEKLTFPEYDYYATLDRSRLNNKFVLTGSTNVSNIGSLDTTTNSSHKKLYYENAFKIPAKILDSVNRYKYIFTYTATEVEAQETSYTNKNSKGKTTSEGTKLSNMIISETSVSQSIFNPWFGVRVTGITLNMPLVTGFNPLNEEPATNINNITSTGSISEQPIQITVPSTNGDVSDCSIQTLVNLSGGYGSDLTHKGKSLGRAKYRWADFMYCKDLGKVSNNHLITLRKFNAPIGDNIFYYGPNEEKDTPDKGRLISWFGTDDNKLEDICKYNYSASWKELNSEIQDIQSKEENGKLLPSVLNIANSNYADAVSAGIGGENNAILNWLGGKLFNGDALTGHQGELADYYYKDKNRVYEPKNTIRDTHIYEGKLTFSQEFTLNFSYKMRSYDGINQKSAFLDLLGNILEVTYRRGSFWGGSYRWLGVPRNNAGWQKANNFIDTLGGAVGNDIQKLMGMDIKDWGEILGNGQTMGFMKDALSGIGLDNMLSDAKDMLSDALNGDFDKFKEATSKAAKSKAAQALGKSVMGMIKNKLGRPAVYAMDSLLTDSPVGLWHVTVGNPRNPILAMGNLIMTGASVQHLGPLGIDDFPTELKVSVTLKHAKSRDITDIANMYTGGKGAIYKPVKSLDDFKKMFPRIWNNESATTKIEYVGEADNEEITSLKATEGYASQSKGERVQLRPEDRKKSKSTLRPVNEVISVGGSNIPEKANFGWDDDETIKKLQLRYILNNL